MLKKIVQLLFVTALILLIPIIASQFVDGWAWNTFDYIFAGIMVFGTGALFELGRSKNNNISYRAGFGLALTAGFMLIWISGAVGIIGSEDNPINLLYLAVLAVGFLSAITTRFKPLGMARTMFGIALGVALIPVVALIIRSTFQELPEAVGVVGVFTLNMFFVVMFIGSGLLFKQSADPEPQTAN